MKNCFYKPFAGLLLVLSFNVQSDPTGAVDSLQLAELIEHTAKMADMVQKMNDQLDVVKQLRDLQEIEAISTISDGAAQVGKLIDETQRLNSNVNNFGNKWQSSLERLNSSLNAYGDQWESASKEERILDKFEAYADATADLDDQIWMPDRKEGEQKEVVEMWDDFKQYVGLKETSDINQADIADGLNSSDAEKICATEMNVLTQLALEEEARRIESELKSKQVESELNTFFMDYMMGADGDDISFENPFSN